jgi:hypothetical protein
MGRLRICGRRSTRGSRVSDGIGIGIGIGSGIGIWSGIGIVIGSGIGIGFRPYPAVASRGTIIAAPPFNPRPTMYCSVLPARVAFG